MEKWVKILESGQMKQGTGQLRDEDNQFCCLGVLCNLHAQAHPELAKDEIDQITYLGEVFYLPAEVMDWAGMLTHNGKLPEGAYSSDDDTLVDCNLGQINDNGEDFKTIAKIIRKNYKIL